MTAPAIPFLHATYVPPRAQEVTASIGYEAETSTVSLRLPISNLMIDSPEVWDAALNKFLVAGDGRVTRQFKQSEFTEFVETLAYSYGVDEREELTTWASNVKAEAAKLKQTGAEWVEVSVVFPTD